MKAEIIQVPTKGLCILISDINPQDFFENNINFGGGLFSDLHAITNQIKIGRKIMAIKEIRNQTGWGLKEAKEYMDKYIPTDHRNMNRDDFDYSSAAERFIFDHTPKDFLKDVDFTL